jgi:putative transposase
MTDAATAPDLADIPARDWQKARRRLEVIRDLAKLTERTRQDALRAAAELNLSLSQLYKVLRRYEADPKLTSLLPDRGGRAPGSRL